MLWSSESGRLTLDTLLPLYRAGELSPATVVAAMYDRIEAAGDDAVWITKVARDEALGRAASLESEADARELPLYGIPFAVKDSIDVAGLPTTAACPAYAYRPEKTAFVVSRLLNAGAILIGKTNLDQFASGLVGVRSPYGATRCPFDPTRISGGSSSGSAVAVATNLVGFALGTDTAGSGRVPAAFTNTVGLKPSHGLLSTAGCVPACRSLDHVSVFASNVPDAAAVLAIMAGHNPEDPYSDPRADEVDLSLAQFTGRFRFGVPAAGDLHFFGDEAMRAAYEVSLERLVELGGLRTEIDYAPFREAGELLYAGPWLAERYGFLREFLKTRPEAFHPVTRAVISGGAWFSAVDAFAALHRRRELRRQVERVFREIDVLALPTAGTHPTFAMMEAEPLRVNFDLGYYTQFANILGCCVAAVPGPFRADGLPFGLSLVALDGTDRLLNSLAAAFHEVRAPRC